jgi:hypothetical protein
MISEGRTSGPSVTKPEAWESGTQMKKKEIPARDVMIESTIDCSDYRPGPDRLPAADDGRRLIHAFTTIGDPALRSAVLVFVQNLAERTSGSPESAVEKQQRLPTSA